MKTIVALMIAGLALAFSARAEEHNIEVGHKAKLTKKKDIEASFAKLESTVSKLGKDSKLTLYEGLPHQVWNQEQLKSELESKATVTRFGFPFYKAPNQVSEDDAKKLKALIRSPKSFMKFQGFKGCGGFHPDFSLVWIDGNDEIEVHICFGCQEIKAFWNDVEVYCDIRGATNKSLNEILVKYYKQRPKT